MAHPAPRTIEDLSSRERLDAGFTKPARLAVIGHPVAHSASPRMHQAALDELGIDARYIKLDVPAGRLKEALSRLQQLGFLGCNITVPHKIGALDACDAIDPAARELGAVNTVRFAGDGRAIGHNTDGPGFERAVSENFGTGLGGLRVLITGAGGGAGQALAMHCAQAGASRLVLVNRTLTKLDPLIARIRNLHPQTTVHALAPDSPQLAGVAHQCQLIVNTSSLGLKDDDPSPLPHDCFAAHHIVFDSIYQPPYTSFLEAAEGAGARIANGASMLLHQGALAFSIWFPGHEPVAAMRAGLAHGEG
jgi:shikimate dehydrogenase